MTNRPDVDSTPILAGKTIPLSLLSSDDEQRAGIRVTRAEFSKMMGCSRQAVTDWVQSGRISVGADGRFDPRQAVTSLLRTGDPSRIRAKVLEPLTRELGAMSNRISGLEEQLALADEEIRFQMESADGFSEVFSRLESLIADEWSAISELPENDGKAVLLDWLSRALTYGTSQAGTFADRARDIENEEGAGFSDYISAIEEGRRPG